MKVLVCCTSTNLLRLTWILSWLQGMSENDFLGLTFENYLKGWPRITGEQVLTDILQVTVSRNKWWNLGILFLMVFAYRVIFFATVKFSERLQPWINGVVLPLFRPMEPTVTYQTIAPVSASPINIMTPMRPLINGRPSSWMPLHMMFSSSTSSSVFFFKNNPWCHFRNWAAARTKHHNPGNGCEELTNDETRTPGIDSTTRCGAALRIHSY